MSQKHLDRYSSLSKAASLDDLTLPVLKALTSSVPRSAYLHRYQVRREQRTRLPAIKSHGLKSAKSKAYSLENLSAQFNGPQLTWDLSQAAAGLNTPTRAKALQFLSSSYDFETASRLFSNSLPDLPTIAERTKCAETLLDVVSKTSSEQVKSNFMSIVAQKEIHGDKVSSVNGKPFLPPINHKTFYKMDSNQAVSEEKSHDSTFSHPKNNSRERTSSMSIPVSPACSFENGPIRYRLPKLNLVIMATPQEAREQSNMVSQRSRTLYQESTTNVGLSQRTNRSPPKWRDKCQCLRCQMIHRQWRDNDAAYSLWGKYPCQNHTHVKRKGK